MSDMSFPFQGTQVADGPGAELGEPRGNRRTLVALLAVGVLIVGALAYFFLLAGGDDPVEDASPVRRTPVVQPTPAPVVTPAPAKAPKLSRKAIGKDPFKPLVVEPVAADSGVTGTAAGGGNLAGAGGNAGVPASGGTTVTGGTTGGGTDGSASSPSPLTVKVLSVAADNSSSRVTVGTKAYSVAVGDTFATYFKTLRLKNGKCGTFQYGDESFE